MECSWADLTGKVKRAASLDEIISAHSEFLSTIMSRALMDDRSQVDGGEGGGGDCSGAGGGGGNLRQECAV